MAGITLGEVHPTAIVSEEAVLGQRVTVGAFAVVNAGVTLGDDAVVGTHCVLGEPPTDFYLSSSYTHTELNVGERSRIRSGSILYSGSDIGSDFETGHRVTIREGTQIGHHTRVGTLSDIQGDCRIGNYVRLHSNVHIGQKSRVNDFVWIFPYSVLTNDPQPPSYSLLGVTVEEFAVIATMVVVLPAFCRKKFTGWRARPRAIRC